MAIAVWFVFTPDVGRRDPRGLGIVATLRGMIAVVQIGTSPPLWIALIGVAGMAASLAIFHWAAFSIRGRVVDHTAPVSGDPRARDSPGGAAARRDGAARGAMAPDLLPRSSAPMERRR